MRSSPQQIEANLATHEQHRKAKCDQCGYLGLMGVLSKQRRLGWVKLMLIALVLAVPVVLIDGSQRMAGGEGVSVFWYIAIGLVIGGFYGIEKITLQCPNCKTDIVS